MTALMTMVNPAMQHETVMTTIVTVVMTSHSHRDELKTDPVRFCNLACTDDDLCTCKACVSSALWHEHIGEVMSNNASCFIITQRS